MTSNSDLLKKFWNQTANLKGWEVVPFENVLKLITYGLTVRPKYYPQGIPLVSATQIRNGIVDLHNAPRISLDDYEKLSDKCKVKTGDILFAKTGAIGHCAICQSNEKIAIAQNVARLVFDESRVIGEFALRYLRTPFIQDLAKRSAKGNAVQDLQLGEIKKFSIPLPPLEEQKRIAEILDRAEELRSKRREAIAQLDTLTQAIFLEMFGDPKSNPKGWNLTKVGEIADVQGGLQVSSSRKKYPREVPYLRVANVYRGFLNLSEIKMICATDAEISRTLLEKNDLLIVEGHGNPNEIGRVALWDGSIPNCIHQNHIIRARFDTNKIVPLYACHYLNSPGGRQHLLKSGKTTSGLNTISVSEVRSSPVSLPPLQLQGEFAQRVEAVEKLKAAHRTSLSELDALFASLQHRAFRGEL
ncbi:restriction endonuclease subunit S [Nostoc sp. FACHB-888]|uniref:restriction endonuclease subunit S n=1 Tax=Nostoc sp. FACHB-888 TaxID=2692842 RepID=UPI0016892DA0|nr:restriction endonuclease subunit S [Nostoc sp. FACHB-888]MBD2247552.1 restriction endonuclease subunit S [Nostoc sp. FACHB-888]